jgi:hypothetical protein
MVIAKLILAFTSKTKNTTIKVCIDVNVTTENSIVSSKLHLSVSGVLCPFTNDLDVTRSK